MAVVRIGEFVRSQANTLGVGKLARVERKTVTIDYFVGPGCDPRSESVPTASVSRAILDCETRVYQILPDKVSWRAGRALVEREGSYLVKFPNARQMELVPATELYTRCDLPLPDPAVFLAARITETPVWQQRRAGFVQAITEQRRACAGLTGLLSSGIDIEPHQVEVVRRVLQDPVQRYLLGDEVGLGKTIEAGVVIRQYVLDYPTEHRVLILVPGHLERQWVGELTHRFRLGPFLEHSIFVRAHDAEDADEGGPFGLVVIDEAHQVARWVASPGRSPQKKQFDALRKLVTKPDVRLLLLTATPTLHSDEVGFQSLLHLLDPVVYPLGDLAGFRQRLERHEKVAQLYHLFRPDEEGSYLETALDQLTEYFPKDVRLNELAKELRPLLAYGADPDDPKREEAVRAVRAHVSEAYRLHRRLLRNRRADERVEGLLPGRMGLSRWEYTDPALPHLAGLLEEWRAGAAAARTKAKPADYGRLLALFADALGSDGATLAAFASVRLGESPRTAITLSARDRELLTATPKFIDETTILARLRDAGSTAESGPRVAALVAGLERLFDPAVKGPTRAVVFATHPHAADTIFAALARRWQGQVLRHGQPGWQHFRTSPSFRVLVCDGAAEEGLNLHGRGTALVHFDLPWSPNRVEQRNGRLDRYGIGTPVRSALPVAKGEPFAAAWADYLDRGYGAFERSIAALQYVTENELSALYPQLLATGAPAVANAADRLAGPEGLVETTLKEIALLDELDAVEAPPGHEHFAEELAKADSTRKNDWQDRVHTWASETLQFARRGDGGPESGVWRYQFRRPGAEGGPSTLMPVERLVRQFSHIIDTEDERSKPHAPLTYALTFDRGRAQSQRVALARFGDPFVTALAEYVEWDDRGAVAALWRYRPKSKYANPAEVAFRFEFVVECPTDAALAALPEKGGWSVKSLRRQADWLFPPFAISVWLNDELEKVTNAARLAVLTEEYSKPKRPDGGRDFNMNPDRWAAVQPLFPRNEWAKKVQKARTAAEKIIKKSDEWESQIESRLTAARRTDADRVAQSRSRLAFLPADQKKAEKARAAVEDALAAALLHGIEKPAVRLDSVGAVFLSNQNPFADMDD